MRPLKYGVETFRAFVNSWYDGTLQDVIFHTRRNEPIRRHICSVLAGYAWDTAESLHRHAGATAAGGLGEAVPECVAARRSRSAVLVAACATTGARESPTGLQSWQRCHPRRWARCVAESAPASGFGKQEVSLDCVVNVDADHLTVIGLLPGGPRVFTVEYGRQAGDGAEECRCARGAAAGTPLNDLS